ncbi:MAG TPA: hypothetical protein VGC36_07040 [Rhizomicrobium sp.]
MSQALDFSGVARPRKPRLHVVPRGGEMDDFWPEMSGRPAKDAAFDPANAPGRVLSEIFILFAAAAVVVLAVTAFAP